MRMILILIIGLFVFSNTQAQDWTEFIKIAASDRNQDDNFGYSVDISGNYAVVGAYFEDEDVSGSNTLNDAGSVYILYNDNGAWEEVQKIVASDRDEEDYFGYSVAISGDYIVVGAWREDHDILGGNYKTFAGSAYIFYNNNGNWEEVQKIVASDRDEHDSFGYSVSISGDYFIVGAFTEEHDASGNNGLGAAGSSYIFYNNNGIWEENQKIVASDRDAGDYFGYSVSVSDNYAVVSAVTDEQDASGGNPLNAAGSAYIFYNNAGTWVETDKVVAFDRSEDDWFGWSVAISGEYVIIGAIWNDKDVSGGNNIANAGSAYIYYNNGSNWEEVQKIVASDREAQDSFGCSVSISGDYIIVGSFTEDHDASGNNGLGDAGSSYIFYNNIGTWEEVQKIVASDRDVGDYFGYSVSVSDDNIIVGAYNENEDASGGNYMDNSGSVYLFSSSLLLQITNQPIDQTDICEGEIIQFSLSAVNVDSYQWHVSSDNGSTWADLSDDATYSGTATNILTVITDMSLNNNLYSCTVTNIEGSISSDTVVLTIIPVTVIITQPESQEEVIAGTDVSFTVEATGSNVTYQWRKDEVNLSDGGNISGTVTAELSLTSVSTGDAGVYDCVLTGDCGEVISDDAILTVTVGINEQAKLGISIYPNPTNGKLNFEFNNNNIKKITISDFTGKTIFEKNEIKINKIMLHMLDLSNFKTGIYIISIHTDKEIITAKVVKE